MTNIITISAKAKELGLDVEACVYEDIDGTEHCYIKVYANTKMRMMEIVYDLTDMDVINWSISNGTLVLESGNDDLETVLKVMDNHLNAND